MPATKMNRLLLSSLLLSVVPASTAFGGARPGARPATTHTAASGKKAKKHSEPVFTGFVPASSSLRQEPLPRPTGHLELSSSNFKGETVSLDLYDEDGEFDEDALDQLYHLWRCRRTGTEKPIDPHLFEILSLVYDRFHHPCE